jgi:hypothetical protein
VREARRVARRKRARPDRTPCPSKLGSLRRVALTAGRAQAMLEGAWKSVNSRFLPAARELGYEIAQVHHWNFPKHAHALRVFDPRTLFASRTRVQHEWFHRMTTFARNFWIGPVDEASRMVLDDAYYLAPR